MDNIMSIILLGGSPSPNASTSRLLPAHDLKADLPRPRKRGSSGFAALERRLLEKVLGSHAE
jgi:hypothetical protein